MHGTLIGIDANHRRDSSATWWFGVGLLVVVIFAALSLVGNSVPDSSPLLSVQPADDTLQSLSSERSGPADPDRYESGSWSIEAGANGIVFVHHE